MIKLCGIVFRFHSLFAVVMLLSLLTGYLVEAATLFTIVLIHELGHVMAAKAFGWKVKEVRLLPFGGVAEMDSQGKNRVSEELAVSIAGPLQNVVMIVFAWGMRHFGVWGEQWSMFFIESNRLIILFNLLPILPLDGGKIVQSVISLWAGYYRTLAVCLKASMALSCAMILVALLPLRTSGVQLNLAVVGCFLAYTNWCDLKNVHYVFLRFLFHRELHLAKNGKTGMRARPLAVTPEKKLQQLVRSIHRPCYHFFYVVETTGELQGILTENRVLHKYLTEFRPDSAVSELFR
ncbi:MAG TPA: M50 family metallopeptidase [Bacilli bacterium]